jgi:hypothetical protein
MPPFRPGGFGMVLASAKEGSCWGVAKLVKALDFDSSMRRFESFLPSQQDVTG